MVVRIEIGDLDGPIGTVSARGKRLSYDVAPEQRRYLHGIVADCREGIDPASGQTYESMPPEQFLRAVARRLSGWTWATLLEDTAAERTAERRQQ